MPGSGTSASNPQTPTSSLLSTTAGDLSTAGSLGSAALNLASGNPAQEAAGALQTGALANQHGLLGTSPTTGEGLGGAMGALQLYQGINQGGVVGGATAATGAAELGQAGATAAGDTALASGLGDAAGAIATPLALYNFANNWQSGNTGSDALSGAESGASIGTAVLPGIGTAVGALIGGAAGALSSVFGGGRPDPETQSWNALAAAQAKNPSQNLMSTLNPSQAYRSLAGIMDAKNNTPGHSTALELVFGRMGEGKLMDQMTSQINSALQSGSVPKNATPAQLYQQVVQPWLTKLGANIPNNAIISSNGTRDNGMVQNLLTQLISQWQTGALNAGSKVGIAGQKIAGLPAYGAA